MKSFFKKTYLSFSDSTDFKKVVGGKFLIKLLHKNEAFTLIELSVSLAIIALITVVVMFNQSNLSEQISLTNQVSDISLQIRQAQVYGVSVKEFNPSSSGFSFTTAYGVDFNIGAPQSNNAGFYTFADLDSNGYFNNWLSTGACIPNSSSECIAWTALKGGNTITTLCAILSSGSSNCGAGVVKRMAITFLRPNPAANMMFFDNTGAPISYPGYLGAEIIFTSPHSLSQTIVVWATGQISVRSTPIL